MKEYEVELEIYARKKMGVFAHSEAEALEIISDVLDTEVIPVNPEDCIEVNIADIYEYDDEVDETK